MDNASWELRANRTIRILLFKQSYLQQCIHLQVMPNRLLYEELSRIEADTSLEFQTLSLAATGLTDHDLRPLVTTLTQLHYVKHLSL